MRIGRETKSGKEMNPNPSIINHVGLGRERVLNPFQVLGEAIMRKERKLVTFS